MIGDMFIYAKNYKHSPNEHVLLETSVLYYLNSDSIATVCVESDIYPYHSAGFDDKYVFKRFYIWQEDPSIYHMHMFSRESNVWKTSKEM